jgi:hypothetical protein
MLTQKFKKILWFVVYSTATGSKGYYEDVNLEPLKIKLVAATKLSEVVAALEETFSAQQELIYILHRAQDLLRTHEFCQSMDMPSFNGLSEEPFTMEYK